MDHYTGIVYQSGSITIHEENNYKSIKSTKDIAIGELLLIEHTFSAQLEIVFAVVQHNEYMFDQYHPRTAKWKENVNRKHLAIEKVKNNSFNFNNEPLVPNVVAKINHSCSPNCAISVNNNLQIYGANIVFMELYAVNNITAGTEITISYGPETSHQRDFVCGCNKPLQLRQDDFNNIIMLGESYSKANKEIVTQRMREHLDTQTGRQILLYQYLAIKGIFINNHKIVAITKEGYGLINNIVNKNNMIDNNSENNGNKIELFWNFVNKTFVSAKIPFI